MAQKDKKLLTPYEIRVQKVAHPVYHLRKIGIRKMVCPIKIEGPKSCPPRITPEKMVKKLSAPYKMRVQKVTTPYRLRIF